MISSRVLCTALSIAAVALAIPACESTPIKQTVDTSRSMAEVGDALGRLVPTLKQTSATLDLVSTVSERNAAGELPKLSQEFSRELQQFESAFSRADRAADGASRLSGEYLEQRRKANAEIADASLRSIDEGQIAGVEKRLQDALGAFASLKGEYEPLLSKLKDLRKYLENNLNAAGVQTAAGQFAAISDAVRRFEPKVGASVATFEKLAASMVPPKGS